MRYDVELIYEIVKYHFGELVAIISKILLLSGPLPIHQLYYLTLRNETYKKNFNYISKNNFLLIRNAIILLIHYGCIDIIENEEKSLLQEDIENNINIDNNKVILYKINLDIILSRIRYPLYLMHIKKILGNEESLILSEIMKYGKISSNILIEELSEIIEDIYKHLFNLINYDFIKIINNSDNNKNKEVILNNEVYNVVINQSYSTINISNNSLSYGDLLLGDSDSYDHNISNFNLIKDNIQNNIENIDNTEIKKDEDSDSKIKPLLNKIITINIEGINNSIYSEIMEETIKSRYNNNIAAIIIRVMSERKYIKLLRNENIWTIDELLSSIFEWLEHHNNIKDEFDCKDKIKSTIIRVLDILVKHTDEFIQYNFNSMGATYKLNIHKIKMIIKYKIILEFITFRLGRFGARIWSMMCNPHILKDDNKQVPNINETIISNINTVMELNSKYENNNIALLTGNIKGRIYWDDNVLAEKCLLPNNITRSLLYSLSNEKFIRVHHSDTITINNFGEDNNNTNTNKLSNNISLTISQSTINKHGLAYSTSIQSTINEVICKILKIMLNLFLRCNSQNFKITKLETRSKQLNQLEVEYLRQLHSGLKILYNSIMLTDKLLLILKI
ncbi:uncharacterized protein CMU_012210 [Cryptosporidium muris RN66]|uniref:DNA-directed RNA polymerase III subunit RPC3 n=1 Tax=Cryptosporidium muris (strain RN66) TaxID=441375 RepID=B6AED0_CRYMR|nr:uncharacterized protein CMU_012210 [Cryptosporidium muris RN66]EEA06547.1 hypothetical protein, conserved [Cryptosporidium muris RN66]|eukprot:XP_002140896.1 hypothetical protein [Cryptosporidium muris RN66]